MAERVEPDYGLIASMIQPPLIAFVASRMRACLDASPPDWRELQAAIRCLTNIVCLRPQIAFVA